MRTHGTGAAAGLALAVIAGCDASGFADLDSGIDTGDTAADAASSPVDTATGGGTTAMMGTQVGSEGFWECPVIAAQSIDGAAPLPALDGTPAGLAAARVGRWTLSFTDTDDGAQAPGGLELVDGGTYLWVDVEESPGCVDHLAVSVQGTVRRGDAWTAVVNGVLAIRPGEGRTILTHEGALGDVEAAWGPSPLDPGLTTFRLDLGIDPTALNGTAAYVDCADVSCAGSATLATVAGSRE